MTADLEQAGRVDEGSKEVNTAETEQLFRRRGFETRHGPVARFGVERPGEKGQDKDKNLESSRREIGEGESLQKGAGLRRGLPGCFYACP